MLFRSASRDSCARRAAVLRLAAFGLVLHVLSPAAWAQEPTVDGPLRSPVMPVGNWWNVDVSKAPVDAKSAAFIEFINNGGTRRLHPDWGGSANQASDPSRIYGLPYVIVSGGPKLVPVTFRYAGESDRGAPGRPPGYPIPDQVKTQPGWMEGGAPAGSTSSLPSASGDRHLLIVNRDNKMLYELFGLRWNTSSRRWEAGSGAVFPLNRNYRRPEGWTSADAAGLAILPGLVRYEEAFGTQPIRHAFRVTVRSTNGYVYPASHRAGSTPGALPFGARLRMKASVDISRYPAPVRRVLQAMKTYGLIVADNGSDMFITGTSDPRWQAQMSTFLSTFHALNANMFEVVKLGWRPTTAATADTLTAPEQTMIEQTDGEQTDDAAAAAEAAGAAAEPEGVAAPPEGVTTGTDIVEALNMTTPDARTEWTLTPDDIGPAGAQSLVVVANPSQQAAEVLVTLLLDDGGEAVQRYAVPAYGQISVPLATDFPDALDRPFGIRVESLGPKPVPIVVERDD